MFTGIIESLGSVSLLEREGGNLHITVKADIAEELKVDQSVAHNGVCLTVVRVDGKTYQVTAIEETLEKSNLDQLKVRDHINLERAMVMGSRLDGHIVQGHVDQTAVCTEVKPLEGSWLYTFTYDPGCGNITIEKGSISVDGVSLTVVGARENTFSVAIIPYTYENTRFRDYKRGSVVNLEFDVIGKYVARLLQAQQ